eukprot:TRINITY_DN1585_c0_g1_i12.p1 TRINITY_DN1585_c0_g1~~TRINITY_DN1585_c0_g1_i12.p1  ORF type:complete len:113 (-),score=9.57 TRINITY_DN1585_c0_g1_i12:183-521(-)
MAYGTPVTLNVSLAPIVLLPKSEESLFQLSPFPSAWWRRIPSLSAEDRFFCKCLVVFQLADEGPKVRVAGPDRVVQRAVVSCKSNGTSLECGTGASWGTFMPVFQFSDKSVQ